MPLYIDGDTPLLGTVSISGAKNSALKLIVASLFSNEDVILENVPRLETIYVDLEIIRAIGGKAEWIGNNKLLLNGANINTFEVPYEMGSKYRTTVLLAGPLLYRFGKAILPKVKNEGTFKTSPLNRFIETWKSLGFNVEEDADYFRLSAVSPLATNISFKTSSHMGTDNAILASIFLNGETIINNASEEPEIDDLINFCNEIGANVKRIEPRKIAIQGNSIFKGCVHEVIPDKTEVALFATAAILTKGNIIIKDINKLAMVPFVNFLTKIGANFDFSGDELKVWHAHEHLEPTNVNISPSPGFVPDWQPFAVLTLTQAEGVSLVHDTVYTNRFDYTRDLNRMGANIELVKPSSENLMPVISDDSYDFEEMGEPNTVAKIHGSAKLKAEKIHIIDSRYTHIYILAALAAEGRSEIHGYRNTYEVSEGFLDKLVNLGAKIKQ